MKLNVLSFRTMEQPECIENKFEEFHCSKLIKKKECVVKTHDRSETFVLQENQNIVNYH
jgi:hypothetical protein